MRLLGLSLVLFVLPSALSAQASLTPPAWARALTGTWSCVGAFATGKPIAADVSFTPSLGGRWLTYHHRDREPGKFEATAMLGPAGKDSAMVPTTIYDNFGGQRRFLPSLAGNEIVLIRDTTVPGAMMERFTFRPRGDGQFWFAWELIRGGTWVLGDSLGCTRR